MNCKVCVTAGDLWVSVGGGGVGQIGGGFSHESEHDLALMVSEFLENGSSGAESWCSSDSDSGLSDFVHLAERIQICKLSVVQYESDLLSLVHSLTLSMNETNLRSRNSGPCYASCMRFHLVKLLRLSGYDAGVCASKWQASGKVPGGDYEYIDVGNDNSGSSERLIIDIDFRSHFEIARAVDSYDRILNSLPVVYVNCSWLCFPRPTTKVESSTVLINSFYKSPNSPPLSSLISLTYLFGREMGGCATKPKVLKGDYARGQAKAPEPANEELVDEKKAVVKEAQAGEADKLQLHQIDDDDDQANKRLSLSSLFKQNENGKVLTVEETARQETSEGQEKSSEEVESNELVKEELPEVKKKPLEDGKSNGLVKEESPEAEEKPSEEAKSNELVKEELPEDEEKPSEETKSSELVKEELPKAEEKPSEEATSNELVKEESPEAEEKPSEEAKSNELVKEELPEDEEKLSEKNKSNELVKEELPKVEEKPSEEATSNELVKEDSPEAEEKPSEEAKSNELIKEDSREVEGKLSEEDKSNEGIKEESPGENQNDEAAEETKPEILEAENPPEEKQGDEPAEQGSSEAVKPSEESGNSHSEAEKSETLIEETASPEKVIEAVGVVEEAKSGNEIH